MFTEKYLQSVQNYSYLQNRKQFVWFLQPLPNQEIIVIFICTKAHVILNSCVLGTVQTSTDGLTISKYTESEGGKPRLHKKNVSLGWQ